MFGSFSNGDQAEWACRSSRCGKIFSGGDLMLVVRWMRKLSGLVAAMARTMPMASAMTTTMMEAVSMRLSPALFTTEKRSAGRRRVEDRSHPEFADLEHQGFGLRPHRWHLGCRGVGGNSEHDDAQRQGERHDLAMGSPVGGDQRVGHGSLPWVDVPQGRMGERDSDRDEDFFRRRAARLVPTCPLAHF